MNHVETRGKETRTTHMYKGTEGPGPGRTNWKAGVAVRVIEGIIRNRPKMALAKGRQKSDQKGVRNTRHKVDTK